MIHTKLITPAPVPLPVRQRLPSSVRINQILDVALEAFATRGFASTSIDDIAGLAGMSKGGIYTHFKSKDDLFEALLERSLTPMVTESQLARIEEPVTADFLIERLIEPMYERLARRETILTIRLLFADGARVPERVTTWRQATIEPYVAMIEKLVRRGVDEGTLRDGVLTQAPWLLVAPSLYAMFWQMIQGETFTDMLAQQRRAHVAMLRELFTF